MASQEGAKRQNRIPSHFLQIIMVQSEYFKSSQNNETVALQHDGPFDLVKG